MKTRLSTLAQVTGGRLIGMDTEVCGVTTDSRKVVQGQLFVALKGERFDGHAYVEACVQQGAAAAVVSHPVAGAAPQLVVQDTRIALGQIAAWWRQQFAIPVAAITGSNGKTTVKEMLAAILGVAAGDEQAVLATQGNLNNDIGVPLTLFRLGPQHRYAVIEMGMNHMGEIAYLTQLARPTAALVNNAQAAHLEGLGSVEAVAHAKGEIFQGLTADGVALVNLDDDFAPLWQSLARDHALRTFGLHPNADVSARYVMTDAGTELTLTTPQGEIKTLLGVPGLHNVRNALAATAAALAMGATPTQVAAGLRAFGGVKGRLQRKHGRHGATIIDDTYNANPASMKAAIEVLATLPGKRLLVLGDMGELGAEAAEKHQEVGALAKAAGIDGLHVLGEMSRYMVMAFDGGARHYESPEALVEALLPMLDAETTVLVKGSRFMKMERVVEQLQEQEEKENPHAA